ncbi:MAG: formate dehydrogenase accessory protein FdhE [Clostridia bacterium]|nr:formate dehydrogenase accessory protein FdhE [Clostridia bacterium]
MNVFHNNNCLDEVLRCGRLYKGFSDAEPLVRAVCSTINQYFTENPLTPLPVIDLEKSTEQIRAGQPIGLNPALVTKDVIELLKRMSKSILGANPQLREIVESLHERFDRFLADFPAEVKKEEIYDLRNSLIKETVLEQDLATFLFSLMLSSLYRQYLQSSAEVLRTDLWEGGDCPLCGEKPHFGMLRPEDGAKQLECWLCGTRWVHTRIKCPFCNNEEQESLGYFTIEGNDICRVNFCKSCRQYYKIFDARKFQTDGDLVLTVHNLATLDYDLKAKEEGFTPGSCLEWVNEKEIANRQD